MSTYWGAHCQESHALQQWFQTTGTRGLKPRTSRTVNQQEYILMTGTLTSYNVNIQVKYELNVQNAVLQDQELLTHNTYHI